MKRGDQLAISIEASGEAERCNRERVRLERESIVLSNQIEVTKVCNDFAMERRREPLRALTGEGVEEENESTSSPLTGFLRELTSTNYLEVYRSTIGSNKIADDNTVLFVEELVRSATFGEVTRGVNMLTAGKEDEDDVNDELRRRLLQTLTK